MSDPFDSVLVNAATPSKGGFRDYVHARVPLILASASEITGLDLSTDTKTVMLSGQVFVYDASDTTSSHDGTSVLVDNGGRRYKLLALLTTEESGFTSGDFLFFYDTTAGAMRIVDHDDLPGASGGDAWSDAVDSDIVPTGADSTYDLGTSTDAFAEAHVDTIYEGGTALASKYQGLDAELTAIAGLTSAADKLPYFTGSGTATLADLSSFGRTLIDDADAATARTTLGLVIGTDVQAQDAELAAIAGLTSAAGKAIRFTGSGTAELIDHANVLDSGPTIDFGTTGDFSPTYDVQYLDYSYDDERCEFNYDIQFDTNAYTTASGAFQVDLPFTHTGSGAVTVNCTLRQTTLPTNTIYVCGQIVPGTAVIIIVAIKDGGNWEAFDTTDFPASTNNFRILLNGNYQIG